MAFATPSTAAVPIPGFARRLFAALAMMSAALIAAVLVALLGWWSLVLPGYAAALVAAVVWPQRFVFVLLMVGLAIEPAAIDFTRPLAIALYEMPPGVRPPLTVSPFEVLLVVTAIALYFRTRASNASREPLPLVLWLVPAVMLFGLVWGLRNGAPNNLAYHEMRGLLYGAFGFFIVWRLDGLRERSVFRWALGSSTVLATILLLRYVFYIRPGNYSVAIEFAYAHEGAVFLAFGFVLGCVHLFRAESLPPRMFALLHCAITLGALIGSNRRAGTLALLVGVIALLWLMYRFRPVLVIAIAVPALMLGTVYLGAYWNKEYGALAQPARAIRSQISPSERDQSSDLYREWEAYNVEQTIRFNRPFGVGFGVPFAQFIPLPDLSEGWPLQSYTPHQNILWLWLKMGFIGISTFLAVWAVAFRRCIVNSRSLVRGQIPYAPMLIAAGLLMYLAFAKVDLAFIGSRSVVPLAALLALALRLPSVPSEREVEK